LHSLHALPVAALAIPTNSAARANHCYGHVSDHNMTDTENDENTSEVTVTRQTVRFADWIRDAEEIEKVD